MNTPRMSRRGLLGLSATAAVAAAPPAPAREHRAWPERNLRYTLDIPASPWLTWDASPALPETAPKRVQDLEEVSVNRLFSPPVGAHADAGVTGRGGVVVGDR